MNRKTKAMLEIAQKSGDWESCLASFSEQHQWILRAIGNKTIPAAAVARKLMLQERSISSAMTKLCRDGVLNRVSPGQYKVVNQSFAAHLELVVINPLTKEELAIEAEKIAYQAMAPFFEALEHQGLIVGNGHHIAQAIASHVKDIVLERWRS